MLAENDTNPPRYGTTFNKMTGKTRITIYLDDNVLAAFRDRACREGRGYQTLINEYLRTAIVSEATPVTIESLRQVLREELFSSMKS